MKKTCSFFILIFLTISLAFSRGLKEEDIAISRDLHIVSLSPALSELLWACDGGKYLVGRSDWCDYPSEILSVPSVGGFSAPTISLERIRILKPDIVFLSPLMHSRLIPALERAGIKVFARDPESILEVFKVLVEIGELCGLEDRAQREAEIAKTSLAELTEYVGKQGRAERPKLFYLLSEEPLISAGGKTFIDDLFRRAGGENIYSSLSIDWPLINMEDLRLKNPDFIVCEKLIYNRLMTQKKEARLSPAFNTLRAFQKGQIIVFKDGELSRPSLRLIDSAWTLARALFSEAESEK